MKQFKLTEKTVLETLEEMRLKCLSDSRFYQGLSVSKEHWHTIRQEAYRDSSISLKRQGRALWHAIKAIKKLGNPLIKQ